MANGQKFRQKLGGHRADHPKNQNAAGLTAFPSRVIGGTLFQSPKLALLYHWQDTDRMNYVWVFLALFGFDVATAFAVCAKFPALRYLFRQEDSLVENLSAASFLGCGLLGLWFWRKEHRKAFLLISVIGFLGFAEDLSYGQRIFHYKRPKILGIRIDCLHDLVDVGCEAMKRLGIPPGVLICLLAGIVASGIGIVVVRRWRRSREAPTGLFRYPPFILAAISVILVLCSVSFDLPMVHIKYGQRLEELFELHAGIALLFCCISLADKRFKRLATYRTG